jgi:O-antigen polymerase
MYSARSILLIVLELIILVALFLSPFIVSNNINNGAIVAKELWLMGIFAIVFLYWGIKLMSSKMSGYFRINWPDIILLIYYLYCILSSYFAPHIPVVFNHKLQLLSGGIVVYFFTKLVFNVFDTKNIDLTIPNDQNLILNQKYFFSFYHIFLVAFLLGGTFVSIHGLLQLYGILPDNSSVFKITGNFYNPAPYAMYLSLVFPIALGCLLDTSFKDKENFQINKRSLLGTFIYYLAFSTIISIILILPATAIRAAWIAALVGCAFAFFFWIKYRKITLPGWINRMSKSGYQKMAIYLVVIILIGSSSLYLLKLKEGSSIGKAFIWEVTLGKIAEKPLFGHGLGRFAADYNNWQAAYFLTNLEEMDLPRGQYAGNTSFCFNEYLEIASETGIFGLILFTSFILVLSSLLIKQMRNKDHLLSDINLSPIHYSFHIRIFPSLIAFLILLAISYPLFNAPLVITFFMLTGISSAIIGDKFVIKTPSLIKFIFIILLFGGSAIVASQLNQQLKFHKNWNHANILYEMGDYERANYIYGTQYEDSKYDGIFLQQYGKSLQMAGQNEKAVDILKQATCFKSDYILFCAMGDAYKDLKEYAKSEEAYNYASFLEPNKLYPHYLLAKLYEISGQIEKAIKKANKIIAMDAKTESMAVKEIKSEMKKLITKN